MFFGVKVVHTYSVGENDRRFYEELILRVNADSFDEAYEKAEKYMESEVCEYTNPDGEVVKTVSIEAVDCFWMYEEEADVQQVYSAFRVNNTGLDEVTYYELITQRCEPEDYAALQNAEFAGKPDLFFVVKRHVDAMDYMALLAGGTPEGEFDMESEEISMRIDADSTVEEISRVMAEVFCKYFKAEESCEQFYPWAEAIKKELNV